MQKTLSITSLIAAATLLLPLSLSAEHHEEAATPPPLTDVWIVVPKQGMEGKFRDAVIADNAYRTKAGDTRDWQAYNVAIGHTMNAVQFRACCFDWADQDAYIAESREKELSKYWGENVHQYVDHYHHYFDVADWKNSHWPDGQGNGPYYGVTTWYAKQGGAAASGQARHKMSQLAKTKGWATDDTNWLWFTRVGGKPITSLVSSYENYADMAPPEEEFWEWVTAEIGEEEAAAMFAAFDSGYKDSDYTVWVHDKEMSVEMDDD